RGAELGETRPRRAEVVELEDLEADGAVAAGKPDAHVDRVELAALAIGAEPATDVQAAVRRDGDGVEGLGPEVIAQLPEGGERGEVRIGAVESADAGAAVIVEIEVRGEHRAQAREVVGVPRAKDGEARRRRTVGT